MDVRRVLAQCCTIAIRLMVGQVMSGYLAHVKLALTPMYPPCVSPDPANSAGVRCSPYPFLQ